MYKLTIEFTAAGQKYFNDAPKMELFSEFGDDLRNTLRMFEAVSSYNEITYGDRSLILSSSIEKLAIKFAPIIPKPLAEPEKLPRRIHARNRR